MSFLDSDSHSDIETEIDVNELSRHQEIGTVDIIENCLDTREKEKLRQTFLITGNYIKVYKRIHELLLTKQPKKFAPQQLLLLKHDQNVISLFVNFNRDNRKYLSLIQKFFVDLEVQEVTDERLKHFSSYASQCIQLSPEKYKHFEENGIRKLHNYLLRKVKRCKNSQPPTSLNISSSSILTQNNSETENEEKPKKQILPSSGKRNFEEFGTQTENEELEEINKKIKKETSQKHTVFELVVRIVVPISLQILGLGLFFTKLLDSIDPKQ